MLDRLPLELVDHVARLALPQPFSFRQYRDRQDTLLALCRTSKAMRAVAQPSLFEAVQLRTAGEVERFVEAVKVTKLGRRVKRVGIEEPRPSFEACDNAALAAACPAIRDLYLDGVDLDLSDLECFPNLRTLVASRTSLNPPAYPFSLPSLEDFSLMFCHFTPTCISTTSLPRLKCLHFQHAYDFAPTQAFLDGLLQHCEALSCDAVDLTDQNGLPALTLFHSRLLVDCPWYALSDPEAAAFQLSRVLAQARSIRVHPHANQGKAFQPESPLVQAELDAEDVVEAAEALHAGDLPHLQALYIPFSLSSSSADLPDALSRLRTACAARNIEVVDEPPFHPYYDSVISREFSSRCKAIKAAEEHEKAQE
ncbi:hypothetical protein JCM10213_002302 [Rhodosporidiobolus nylandii]